MRSYSNVTFNQFDIKGKHIVDLLTLVFVIRTYCILVLLEKIQSSAEHAKKKFTLPKGTNFVTLTSYSNLVFHIGFPKCTNK